MTKKTYIGEAIDVTFDLKQCIHAAKCIHGLPEVFDTKKRPWIQIGASEAQALIDVVGQCPSGALRAQNKDGSEIESTDDTNTIKLVANGPLYVRGDIKLAPPRGQETEPSQEFRLALCRCGASENKPFCDNSHRKVDFKANSQLPASSSDDDQAAAGALTVQPIPNGPLLLKGDFQLQDDAGNTLFQGRQAAVCRCGASMNKPFCDSTHKTIGFKAP